MNFAPAIWGIPVVTDASARGFLFPNPDPNQRVQNLATGNIERWTGSSWTTDVFSGTESFNVRAQAYGAVGDGIADDTVAIQRALDASTAAGGGTVFFPNGTYLVSATLLYGSNALITGQSFGATITLKTGLSTPKTIFAPSGVGVSGTTIQYITINHRSDVYGNNGSTPTISVQSTIGCTVSFNHVLNAQTMAVWFDSPNTAPTKRLWVHHNWINGSAAGGVSVFGSAVGLLIEHNMIEGCQDDAIAVQDSANGQPTDFSIDNNILLNNNVRNGGTTPHGILAYGCTRGTITGNVITNTVASCIAVQMGAFNRATHISVTGNTCTGAGNTISSLAGVPTHGIHVLNVDDVLVSSNICNTNVANGLAIVTCTKVSVSGNTAYLNGASGLSLADNVDFIVSGNLSMNNGTAALGSDVVGILLVSDSGVLKNDRGTVSNNRCGDDRPSSKTQTYGIFNSGGSNTGNLRLLNNDVTGNGSAGIGGSFSTACSVRDNPGYNPVGLTDLGAAGGSPYTYTAGVSPELISVRGGTVSGITKGGVTIAATTNQVIPLQPNQSIIITYSVAPSITRDIQ